MRICPRCRSVFQGEVTRCGIDGEALQTTDTDPLIGQSIGNYRITALLGEGGMSRVYRASHHTIGSEVAIKVLLGDIAINERAAERFRREADAMAKIHHRNVAGIHDYGTTTDKLTYMAMELLHGRSLADAIAADGKFSPQRASRITRQVAAGLNAAHALGFVHRDLKPGNLMLIHEDGEEVVKILDFGLVRAQGDGEAENVRLTKTGYTLGTPLYMAPEQIRGEPATPATDLYALGVVLYEMLTGRPPFDGKSNAEVCYHHTASPPPVLADAEGLEDLALHLLHKRPDQRPGSAQEVIEAITSLPLHTSTSVRRAAALSEPAVTYGDVIPVLRERRRWLPTHAWHIAGIAALFFGIVGVVWWWSSRNVVDLPSYEATTITTDIVPPHPAPPPPVLPVTAPVAPAKTPTVAPTPAIVSPPPMPVPTESDRAALTALRRAIERDASVRGLTMTDLPNLPTTAATFGRWRRATSAQNLTEATRAALDVRSAIAALVIDAATIDAKLRMVRTALAGATMDPVRAVELDTQLGELERAARSDRMTDNERPKLFQRLAVLERAIRTAPRP
ncbi:serine/threonine protein kinase [Candidatus Uhrbacteria bacterium]|nr:serine/threonine protein kinase [Candidatus Uhrbacteria bacterium]